MRTTSTRMAMLLATVLAAGTASAGNPDPATRRDFVVSAFGQVLLCQGGPNDGTPCNGNFDCNQGDPSQGTCDEVRGARLVARGVLTVISDTILATPIPADPFLETAPAAPCTTCEGAAGRSSYTLLLEFSKDGRQFTFAETFPGLTSDIVNGFGSQLPGQTIPSWSFGAFESTNVNSGEAPDGSYKIRFGLLPPAAASAVAAALGEPGRVPVVLEAEEIAACTDPVACNHCPGGSSDCVVPNSRWSKHSAGNDPLASVRKLKVGLGFIDPPAP